MKQQESIAQHFGFTYFVAASNLEGMTKEHSLAAPSPGGNCANWILGHLTDVQNAVMGLAGAEPVWDTEQLKRASYDPITSPANAIDWDTMKAKFLGSKERCLAAIAAIPDEKLEDSVPHPFGGTATRVELLNLLAFHQAYHAGQLGVARRVAGLPGAIKAPGQVEMEAGKR